MGRSKERGSEPHKGGRGCVSEHGPRFRHLRKPGAISHPQPPPSLKGRTLGPRAAGKKNGQLLKGLVCQPREVRL